MFASIIDAYALVFWFFSLTVVQFDVRGKVKGFFCKHAPIYQYSGLQSNDTILHWCKCIINHLNYLSPIRLQNKILFIAHPEVISNQLQNIHQITIMYVIFR